MESSKERIDDEGESLPVVYGRPIDPAKDCIISFSELAKEMKVRANTVYQWSRHGRISANRRYKVVMQSIKMTHGLATSTEAYFEFLSLLNSDSIHPETQHDAVIEKSGMVRLLLEVNDIRWICSRLEKDDPLRIMLSQTLNEI